MKIFGLIIGCIASFNLLAGSFNPSDCAGNLSESEKGLCYHAQLNDVDVKLLAGGIYLAGIDKAAYLCNFKLTDNYEKEREAFQEIDGARTALGVANDLVHRRNPTGYDQNPKHFCRQTYSRMNNQKGYSGKKKPPTFK